MNAKDIKVDICVKCDSILVDNKCQHWRCTVLYEDAKNQKEIPLTEYLYKKFKELEDED